MITVGTNDDGLPRVTARVSGIAAYLDNFAIIDLAKGDEARRESFLNALHRGGSLLFSMANVVELTGPQGASKVAVDDFLASIGPNWVPIRFFWDIVDSESEGADPTTVCVATDFMHAFFQDRLNDPGRGRVIDLSPEWFWDLRSAANFSASQRETLRKNNQDYDRALFAEVAKLGRRYNEDPDILVPAMPFDPRRRATYVAFHLNRKLIQEAKSHQLKKGDAMDFSHAVVGAAFGSFALLDRHWKRRLTEAIPDAARIARLYYGPELDTLVGEFDEAITNA